MKNTNLYLLTILLVCSMFNFALAGGNWETTVERIDNGGIGAVTRTGTPGDVAVASGNINGADTYGLAFASSGPLSFAEATFDGAGTTRYTFTWKEDCPGDPVEPLDKTFSISAEVTVSLEKAVAAISHGEDDPTVNVAGAGAWSGRRVASAHSNLTLEIGTPLTAYGAESDSSSPSTHITSSPATVVLQSFVSDAANTWSTATGQANSFNSGH